MAKVHQRMLSQCRLCTSLHGMEQGIQRDGMLLLQFVHCKECGEKSRLWSWFYCLAPCLVWYMRQQALILEITCWVCSKYKELQTSHFWKSSWGGRAQLSQAWVTSDLTCLMFQHRGEEAELTYCSKNELQTKWKEATAHRAFRLYELVIRMLDFVSHGSFPIFYFDVFFWYIFIQKKADRLKKDVFQLPLWICSLHVPHQAYCMNLPAVRKNSMG